MATKRGPVFWIGCGCLALLVGCSGLGAAGFFGVTSLLKGSAPYHDSLAAVNANGEATQTLGSPIEAGWWVMGSVSESGGGGGSADLSFPVHGPSGKGNVSVTAHRVGGKWIYDRMALQLNTDPPKEIDLLSPSDETIEHL